MIIRDLGASQPYKPIWQAMLDTIYNADLARWQNQIWLLEHQPVFTVGQGGEQLPFHNPNNLPVVTTDRGGDITYHGPGQLIIYCLFDLRQLSYSLRQLIEQITLWVITYLDQLGIASYSKPNQPGVFINEQKICSLGLRVKRGITYHGLALNIDMDLTPFEWINPCGYSGLQMTNLKQHKCTIDLADAKQYFSETLANTF